MEKEEVDEGDDPSQGRESAGERKRKARGAGRCARKGAKHEEGPIQGSRRAKVGTRSKITGEKRYPLITEAKEVTLIDRREMEFHEEEGMRNFPG